MSPPDSAPVVINGGDRTCTALLLELRSHLTQFPPATVIHLIARDTAAPLDPAAWCHLTGHTYLGPVPAPAAAPAYARRTSATCRPTQPLSPGDTPKTPNDQADARVAMPTAGSIDR